MKCSFCGETLRSGTGKMFVKTSGEIFYFDKAKCEKYFFMGKKSKKLKWARKK